MKKYIVIVSCLIYLIGCRHGEEHESARNTDSKVYLQLENILITQSEKTKLTPLKFDIEMPYLREGDSLVIVNGYLANNRKISIKDSIFVNSFMDGKFQNSDFEKLFENHFNSKQYDWTLNLMLQQKFNIGEVDLRRFVPNDSKKWRVDSKKQHGEIWSEFFNKSHSVHESDT